MGCHKRGPWSQNEDLCLLQLVQSQGPHNWVRVSHLIVSRSPKQCRERYHQNLKPTLNHEPITPDEGAVIERLVGEMGKRWAEIARRLRGRSDNAVKNWWNGGMNRRRRIAIGRENGGRGRKEHDETAEPLSFARPVNTLPQPPKSILIPPHAGRIELPLISPAVSDISMADSVGEAPSLVSDSSSNISVSPNATKPPYSRFPPRTPRVMGCGPTLPAINFGSHEMVVDGPSPAQRHDERQKQTSATHQRLHQFAQVATSTPPALIRTPTRISSSQTQCQLPPFQSLIHNVDTSRPQPSRAVMSVSDMLL